MAPEETAPILTKISDMQVLAAMQPELQFLCHRPHDIAKSSAGLFP
jgi:hypothetical protein